MRDSELSMPPTKHSNDGWGSFMRVRVLIDISQPLCRGRVIALDDDRDQWVSFKYEQLPNLCFWCLTHNDKDCDLWIESEGTLAETEKQYRPWIKALSFNGKHRPVVSTLGFYTKKTAKPTKERSQGTTHQPLATTKKTLFEMSTQSVTPASLKFNFITSKVKLMNYLIYFEGDSILYYDIYRENK